MVHLQTQDVDAHRTGGVDQLRDLGFDGLVLLTRTRRRTVSPHDTTNDTTHTAHDTRHTANSASVASSRVARGER
jgi:hypothetical protein